MKQGKALHHNIGIALWYNRELNRALKEMFDDTLKTLVPTIKETFAEDSVFDITVELDKLRKKYTEYFYRYGKELAKKFMERSIRHANISVKKAIEPITKKEFKLAGSIINEANRGIVKMAIYNNVSLIRSIPEEYYKNVTGIVSRSMQGGSIAEMEHELLKFIKLEGKKAQNRAKLIAYDQTRKVYSDIALNKIKQAGFTKVMWLHGGGDKVPRCYHVTKWDGKSGLKNGRPNGLNGFVFEIDNPPVIQKANGKRDEVRGFPAQLINCTCFLKPVEDE